MQHHDGWKLGGRWGGDILLWPPRSDGHWRACWGSAPEGPDDGNYAEGDTALAAVEAALADCPYRRGTAAMLAFARSLGPK